MYVALQMLGVPEVTLGSPGETQGILHDLAAKCASVVDEIRKAIALADPEGHNSVEWSALQTDEVRGRNAPLWRTLCHRGAGQAPLVVELERGVGGD